MGGDGQAKGVSGEWEQVFASGGLLVDLWKDRWESLESEEPGKSVWIIRGAKKG